MKTYRYFSESRQTCYTDDSEAIESRQSILLQTKQVSSLLVPAFRNKEVLNKAGILLKIEIDEGSNETLSEDFKDEEEMFRELIREVNEEYSHQWLPNPCFVHPESMDFSTPKRAFSPNKPRGKRVFN
jgi:transposase InsO family protein